MNIRKTAAFYIETLLLTLFLLALTTVLVQMFALSRNVGYQAQEKTEATLIAQNATALCITAIQSGAEPAAQTRYNARGEPDEDGAYRVSSHLETSPAPAGQMHRIVVRVYGQAAPDEQIFSLQTDHYSPAAP